MTPESEAPIVSVVIPAYNAAWCIRRAIDSVLAQTFPDFELIVVDDGSTDETSQILKNYADAIQVVSKPNGGMSSARNAGIRVARGRYLAFLDADDYWMPGKLSVQVECMETRSNLAFCAVTALLKDPQEREIGEWACSGEPALTLAAIFANHSTIAGGASSVIARRELVELLGGFDETLWGAEDTDLWIRLAAQGGFKCIAEPLVVVLKRPDSVSRNRHAMRRGALDMTRKNRHLLPLDLRGAFWRCVYAGVLCDYAKWAYRDGRTGSALRDLCAAFFMAPASRGKLVASLLMTMLSHQRL